MTIGLMTDFETLDNKATAAVRSAGLVLFEYESNAILDMRYVTGIAIDPQLARGRTISWDTLTWWSKQSDEARAAMFTEGWEGDVGGLLITIAEMVRSQPNVEVWGNGANFDVAIMDSLYATHPMQVPYSYRNVRCYREFMQGRQRVAYPEVSHHALHDAIAQAKNVQYYYQQQGV